MLKYLLSLLLVCVILVSPVMGGANSKTVELDITTQYSRKNDCVTVCIQGVLAYYGIQINDRKRIYDNGPRGVSLLTASSRLKEMGYTVRVSDKAGIGHIAALLDKNIPILVFVRDPDFHKTKFDLHCVVVAGYRRQGNRITKLKIVNHLSSTGVRWLSLGEFEKLWSTKITPGRSRLALAFTVPRTKEERSLLKVYPEDELSALGRMILNIGTWFD